MAWIGLLLLLAQSAAAQTAPTDPNAFPPSGTQARQLQETAQPARPDLATAPSLPLGLAEMRNDARLCDVCFPDARHGWAVGDRGVVWYTEDGGRHWELQESGLACTLESVWFVNPEVGWAAGGFSHPYLHNGTGVVLMTEDGGRHWTRVRDLLLPALKRIRFFDPKHGWAIGGASALVPSGVLVSDTGGQSWRAIPGGAMQGWLTGDLLNPDTGVLLGHNDQIALLRRGAIERIDTPGFALRRLAGIRLVAPGLGWLVGDDGLVTVTGDLGTTWQAPHGKLPEGLQHEFDWIAVATSGTRVWIAGSPGTRVLHSPDAGRTWTAFATGQSLPIQAMVFADDRHGWAVGALGTILQTDDGGQTWRRQRAGGTRAALLGIFGTAEDVPLELFALLSGNDGYLGVVDVLNRQDVEVAPRGYVPPADRLREAVLGVGGSEAQLARRFPLRQPGLHLDAAQILEGWDRVNDGCGLDALRAHLVRQIRTLRPDVIITHDASPRDEDPLGHLINQAVLQAVEEAADPASHPGQIAQAALEPWKVRRVYAALAPGVRGANVLSSNQLAIRLGRSLGDVAADARGLVADHFATAPEMRGFRPMMDQLAQDQQHQEFFAGIVLSPGGEARRLLGQPPAEGLAILRRTAQKRRIAEAILLRSENDSMGGLQLLAQTDKLLEGLDPASAGQTLYQMADHYLHSGHMPMAAEVLESLVKRYPEHPLASAAFVWLLQYYASGEVASREQPAQPTSVQQATTLSADISQQENHSERAASLAAQLQRTRPDLCAEPAIGFPLAVVDRREGRATQAEQFYAAQRRRATHDAWWACAQGEAWLAHRSGPSPKPLLHCARAVSKPRLDGKLDEPLWQHAEPGVLTSAQQDDAQWPARVMLAHDEQFLYIAIQCACAPGASYEDSPGPRPRDADLSAHDRVDLLVDLDRDYASYYRLTIDHRGWTGEECWGDRTWNPNWFVAASRGGGAWTAEAAISLNQLIGRTPRPGEVWAVGIQRTAPGAGFQSWSTPASVDVVPAGFGYLLFE